MLMIFVPFSRAEDGWYGITITLWAARRIRERPRTVSRVCGSGCGSGDVARVDDVELAPGGTRQGFPRMRGITRNAILMP